MISQSERSVRLNPLPEESGGLSFEDKSCLVKMLVHDNGGRAWDSSGLPPPVHGSSAVGKEQGCLSSLAHRPTAHDHPVLLRVLQTNWGTRGGAVCEKQSITEDGRN